MDQQFDFNKPEKKKKRISSRELIELELRRVRMALQANQYEAAKVCLDKLVPEQIPTSLLPRYYALCGEAKIGLGESEDALFDLEKSLQIFEKKGPTPTLEVERVRNWLGLAYYNLNKYQLALDQHMLCLKAIQRGWIDDLRFTMQIYCNLANENHHLGNHQEALEQYRKALSLADRGQDKSALAAIYWGLGLAYRSIDNLATAKLYFHNSANLYQELGELNLAGTVKTTLGLALVERKEFVEAEEVLQSALKLAEESKDDVALGIAYGNLANLYKVQKDLVRAAQNATVALELLRRANNKVLLGQSLGELAEIKIMQEASEEGLGLFKEAVLILEQTESTEYLKKICFRYANALEKTGNLRESIKYFKRAYFYQSEEHKKPK